MLQQRFVRRPLDDDLRPGGAAVSAAAHATQLARLVPPDTVKTWFGAHVVAARDRLAERHVPVLHRQLRHQV